MTSGWRRAFRRPPDRDTLRDDVAYELRFHLEEKVARLVREGMGEEEAWAEARRRFGDMDGVKARMMREGGAEMRRAATWDRLRQDVRYAVRQATRAPSFSAITALTLALGIGATTAIFSVVDGIVFRPLPFPDPDELVAVWADLTRRGGPADEWMNFPDYFDLKERSRTLGTLAAWDGGSSTVTGVGDAERIVVASVSHEMLTEVIPAEPLIGRTFTAQDDRPDAERTVLLTHGYWRRALGGAPDAVGRTISLNDVPHTVIGVLPEAFEPPIMPNAEVWLPIRVDRVDNYCGRGGACTHVIGRLADGVSLEQAQAEASDIAARLEREHPEANANQGLSIVRLKDDMIADARPGLLVLLAAVGLVLLIACVNVANLLLARGSTRGSELAVRSALGAGRTRITAQLLTESALLAGVGGGLGLLLAYYGTRLLVAIAPAGTPRLEGVGLDARVLAFSLAVTVLAGLVFGTVPALRAAREDVRSGLGSRDGGGADRSASIRGRGLLVSSQVALALVLLVSAGLLVRSFQNLRAEDLGFRPQGVVTARFGLPGPRYPDAEARRQLVAALEERVGALPGVEAVGTTSWLPLTDFGSDVSFNIEGRPLPPLGQGQAVWYRRVTPGYPEAIGMTLVSGRWLRVTDVADAPPVVVINDGLARRHFPGESPLGHRINLGDPETPLWREIVGVAAEARYFGIREDSRDGLYIPFEQATSPGFALVARSSGDLSTLGVEIRRVVAEIDPSLAVGQVEPMTAVVDAALGPERFVTMLTTLFAILAFVLAAVGLYGVVSYGVSQRLREMGVRLALGAGGGDIRRLVLGQSLAFVAVGLAVGIAVALQVTRLMGNLLFGVSPADPWTYGAVGAAFTLVAAAAAAVPARRAARVDPIRVLRAE